MNNAAENHFDQSAVNWDVAPQRAELANAVGKAIMQHVRPTREMDMLDYGCGTGLVGVFLLPHVRSVVGADNSPAMLQVLDDKIQVGGLRHIRTKKLDLERDPVHDSRYHLIVSSMVTHHVADVGSLLTAFRRMLHPGGFLAIADLDTEPGLFHSSEAVESVHHHGFDRGRLKERLLCTGFADAKDTTAHVIRKPGANGEIREFPVFLIVGQRGNPL